MAFCTGCGAAIDAGGRFCASCGKAVAVAAVAVSGAGALAPGAAPAVQDDATGGVIPYKNVPALVGYYLGVFSVIPCFPIGIAGMICGIVGLRRYRANPVIKGAVHAWIGIVAGGIFGVLWTALTVIGIYSAAAH